MRLLSFLETDFSRVKWVVFKILVWKRHGVEKLLWQARYTPSLLTFKIASVKFCFRVWSYETIRGSWL